MKLAPEREFKTVFLGITKKKFKVVAFSLFAGFVFFVNIACCISDHLFWNHVLNAFNFFSAGQWSPAHESVLES